MTIIPGMGYVPDRPSDPPEAPACPVCDGDLVVSRTSPWTAPTAECFDCGYTSDDECEGRDGW